VAEPDETVPRKSTSFCSKLLTGLVCDVLGDV
jgi:uncharacterized protein (DUF1015 family)